MVCLITPLGIILGIIIGASGRRVIESYIEERAKDKLNTKED